jgi:hypothetical protein
LALGEVCEHTLIVTGASQLHDLPRARVYLRILFLSYALLQHAGQCVVDLPKPLQQAEI